MKFVDGSKCIDWRSDESALRVERVIGGGMENDGFSFAFFSFSSFLFLLLELTTDRSLRKGGDRIVFRNNK